MTTTAAVAAPAASTSQRYPPQAFYVIFTEGAERMSYYGLTAVLTSYMVKNLGFTEAEATIRFSMFSGVVYLAPLFGGWLADRYLGRYRAILYVSVAYVLGHAVLSAWDSRAGLYLGCALVALGAGGIKPNVSVFMGDQFRPEQEKMLERAYGWFYFSINVGSALGIALVSETFERKQIEVTSLADWWARHHVALAFGIPGIAMGLALAIYFAGRRHYTRVPPTGPNPNGFVFVLAYAVSHGMSLDAARAKFPEEAVNGVRAVFRIGLVFAFTSVFWALFFQYGGSWQIQADKLDRNVFGWNMGAGMLSQLNTLFVLALIPVVNAIYKRLEQRGRPLAPLRKMTLGMFVAPVAFLAALALQYRLDQAVAANAAPPHALWQAVQYFFLSLAEVLISITGLEFAFTQAPKSMKGVVMGMWFLYFSIGAQLSAVVAKGFTLAFGEPINWQAFFLVFFGISAIAAVGFSVLARWYKPALAQPA